MNTEVKASLYDVVKVTLEHTADAKGEEATFVKVKVQSRDLFAGRDGTFTETSFLDPVQVPAWVKLIEAHERWLINQVGKCPIDPMQGIEVIVRDLPQFYCRALDGVQWLPEVHDTMKVFVRCYNGIPVRDARKKALGIIEKLSDRFQLLSKSVGQAQEPIDIVEIVTEEAVVQ